MRERPDDEDRKDSEAKHDPLLDGADVPDETPTEDVVPEDVGSEKRSRPGTDPKAPLP